MRVTIMFLLDFLLIKRNYVKKIFTYTIFLVDTNQNAIISFLTYLRLMQFSCTKIGKFPDSFISLNRIQNFDTPR